MKNMSFRWLILLYNPGDRGVQLERYDHNDLTMKNKPFDIDIFT